MLKIALKFSFATFFGSSRRGRADTLKIMQKHLKGSQNPTYCKKYTKPLVTIILMYSLILIFTTKSYKSDFINNHSTPKKIIKTLQRPSKHYFMKSSRQMHSLPFVEQWPSGGMVMYAKPVLHTG